LRSTQCLHPRDRQRRTSSSRRLLAAGLCAGRADEPIAESARSKIIEVAPGDWRLQMIIDHAVEVIADESFPGREQAVEAITDRLEACPDWDNVTIERIQ